MATMVSYLCNSFWLVIYLFMCSSSIASQIHDSKNELYGNTAISDFRILNRRSLIQCADPNPHLQVNLSTQASIADEQNITVTVSGVLDPQDSDWVAMISPSHANVSSCPLNALLYIQTGDLSNLPLLCHYPVKAQFLSTDPSYLNCGNLECRESDGNVCSVKTCSGSVTFHVVNIRTDIEFVLFGGGFLSPCILKRSDPLSFANPNMPLYGHLSSIDSTGESMRLTWVSGDKAPQEVQYGNGRSEKSIVTTFTQDDMCSFVITSPAIDFGWHDPGYIHTAVITGLKPSQTFSYRYGSNSVGWSEKTSFRTPPAAGADELTILAFGDMGKAPRDPSTEHFIQPGSLSVMAAMADEVAQGKVDSIFHIGDISYATGFLVEWDYFLHLITPVASHVSYMTAIGNHERDYADSGSIYQSPDSGGECGVAYETYFPMPTSDKDKPWYSIELGSVHFTVISTEHDWTEKSEQYEWMKKDMGSVDRARTPWLIFTGHRPMYSSGGLFSSVDSGFVESVEPLLMNNQVDLVLFGHVHNYERTCAVFQNECKSMPKKDKNGIDTYNNGNYSAPIHAIIGMAGFSLDKFPTIVSDWSLSRNSEFGYVRIHATMKNLNVEFVNSTTRDVGDSFILTK